MFPLRDHNPSERTPFVTWALIAVNVVVFLSYFPSIGGSDRLLMAFYSDWALVPAEVSHGIEMRTIVTSMFLHGGWMHIIGNMLFLWIFGDNLEDQLGHVGFLLFYLVCGVAAAMGQVLADPTSTVPMVGASGAIAGVMGGYLLMFPKARVDLLFILFVFIRVVTVPAWLMLGLWFGMQLANGASSVGAGGGVAYWAHIGGFVAGVILILPAWLRRGGPAFWDRTHGRPPHEEVQYPETRRSAIPLAGRRGAQRQGHDADPTRVPRAGQRRSGRGSPWGGHR
ncbi:rhomboid family intramembrane serine protease [Nioella nitratireducens]|uniref:rhomboid family intramembrane serine protease n=1 Tax=Nioella nitratireducens TaxID=1287720 RepID=UPI0008FCE6D5|nr:rhomboid family intramembrane serine protease [Nioella nitratireducens]